MPERHYLRQFLLLTFALLIPAFVLWTFASGPLAMPIIGLCKLVLLQWLPEMVQTVLVEGPKALVMTRFGDLEGQIVAASVADGRLGFYVDSRLLSYSLPFYTALHFATSRERYLSDYLWGFGILYAVILVGMLCVILKELMVTLGERFLEHSGSWVPGADFIALLFQLNTLIVPSLAPIMVWAWQSRDTPLVNELRARVKMAQTN